MSVDMQYPRAKVISSYTLCGGAIGAFLLLLFTQTVSLLLYLIEGGSLTHAVTKFIATLEMTNIILFPIMLALVGTLFGDIPAIIKV